MRLRLLSVLLLTWPLLQAGPAAKTVLRPAKTTTPPVLDGKLDDPVGPGALGDGFRDLHPGIRQETGRETIAYMAYDEQNLYFAFRCFDDQPDKIKATLTRRDDIAASDFVCITFDTFNDQQSLYAFYVTPLGVQGVTAASPAIKRISVSTWCGTASPASMPKATRWRSAFP